MHFLYTRHLPSGEALHEIIDAPNERVALRTAKTLAQGAAADGRGGTVQVLDGAGRFLLERQAVDTFKPSGRGPSRPG